MELIDNIVRWADPTTLIFNKQNPPDRIRKSKKYYELKAEITANNNIIAAPVYVNRNLELTDGHRRTTIALDLGIQVPYLMYDTVGQGDFLMIQNSTAPLTGFQMLQIYLKGGLIVAKIAEQIILVKRYGGMTTLRKILDKKKSVTSYAIGLKQIQKMVPEANEVFMRKALNHMVKFGAYDLKVAIRYGITKEQMKYHISKGIRFNLTPS